MEIAAFAPNSKCSIFHNIFKCIVFQMRFELNNKDTVHCKRPCTHIQLGKSPPFVFTYGINDGSVGESEDA